MQTIQADPILETTLKKVFGFDHFRSGQREAVQSILNGQDTFAILPTGAGKSLIYQLASVLLPSGVTIVVSPLIALMKDQADSLNGIGIIAETCNSTQDELTQMKVLSQAVQGKLKILFVSPERVTHGSFERIFLKINVNLLVIDEAHCVSQWGHDFRPSYRSLAKLREAYKSGTFPIVALTATATEQVVTDTINNLGMNEAKRVQSSFYRKNLKFLVEYPERVLDKKGLLLKYLDSWKNKIEKGRCIIYCATRAQVDEVYDFLKNSGFNIGKYHAGRTDGIRERTQNAYASGKVRILIATNAFGMGIDHPDVRLVLHYQAPASMEAYYQEAGRAGRDGKDSLCVLFFHNADLSVQQFIISKETNRKSGETLLGYMRSYGKSVECRQRTICSYFGENLESCGICDNCQKKHGSRDSYILREIKKSEAKESKASYDFDSEEEKIIYDTVRSLEGKFGKTSVVSLLKGSRSKDAMRKKLDRFPEHGKLNHIPESALTRFLENALEKRILSQKGDKYPKIFLTSQPPFRTKKIKDPNEVVTKRTLTTNSMILMKLKNYRDAKARKLKWKKFMVLQNPVLKRIAEDLPRSKEDLMHIKGMGESKVEKYGDEILKILSNF
ncbi:MAG: ATP-dependent DNA helicase RecQ [Leptospira sp.]|nr:ATP-dependent DNA helicase RecQ [Leptospira sp.]